jgi:germination protein YpeB
LFNKEIKGLNFSEIAQSEVKELAAKIFDNSKVSFVNETNGKFSTYDYNIKLDNGLSLYAQLTKKGGRLLTLSSYTDNSAKNYTIEQAITIAEEFAKKQGINDVECVWSDIVENNAYVNLAPVVDKIIYYPDLIKVKIDLSSGEVLGWEATTYYTNHTERDLPAVVYSSANAQKSIDGSFTIEAVELALSPIEDYNEEVLTYEIKCTKGGSIYYFYI